MVSDPLGCQNLFRCVFERGKVKQKSMAERKEKEASLWQKAVLMPNLRPFSHALLTGQKAHPSGVPGE